MNGGTPEVLETRTYNAQHQPLTVTDASGKTTTYTYNTRGQVLTVTTPPRAGITENRTTTYTYDPPTGYLMSIRGPGGDLTIFRYDTYGRVWLVTPNEGDMLTYEYDALDRTTRITFPDMSYEEFIYDKLDLERRRDRLGRVTRWVHDALRRVEEVHEDNEVIPHRTTNYTWCSCGSLDRVTDPNGNETTWTRDLQGRVEFETRDDGAVWQFTYEDTTSRLKQRKDAKQQVTTYQYWVDDKLKQVSYSNTQVATPTVSLTYDPIYGRLATMTDGNGVTTYAYHPITAPTGATRLASVDGPLSNDVVAYTYDELGRIKTRSLSAAPLSFTYDQMGRVTAVGSPIGSFTYGFSGTSFRPQTLSYPNGQVTEYNSFIGDPRRGIKYNAITHRAPGGAELLRFDGYGYDIESNIRNYSIGPQTHDFDYDGLDQIIDASVAPPPALYNYGYDLAGNRTSEGLVTSAYNNRNQLTSRDGVTYTYDPNGNLASHTAGSSGPARTFEWDAENRLVRILVGATEQARFKYDGLGRRVQKVASGVTRDYVYDEERLVEERFGTTTRRFIDAPGVDQHLVQYIVGGSVNYMLPDHLGSIHRETDSAGAITLTRLYDPYGNLLQGATTGGHAFTGREWDSETGLYSYRARYYDPKVGRFISEDPIGFESGVNFYAYVGNNPVNRRDPYGLQAAREIMFPPAAARTHLCVDMAFRHWFSRGDRDGWRYAHCMAACESRKCGLPASMVQALGAANEANQTWECFTTGNSCHTAWAERDFQDNETGYSCPPNRSCEEQCKGLHGLNKTPREFGPFYRGPR